MNKVLCSLLLYFSLGLISNHVKAQLLPTQNLTPYSDYRKEIIKLGWLPKATNSNDEFEELSCGNSFCTAEFVSENKKQTLLLSVWFVVMPGKVEYFVAPSFEIIDSDVTD